MSTAPLVWVLLAALAQGPAEEVQLNAPHPPGAKANSTGLWGRLSDEERAARLQKLGALPFDQRLLQVSEGFVGTPYVFSPLGEGEGFDPDPVLRYDAVDCLTFVETALAMARAGGHGEVSEVLQDVRYDGPHDYAHRKHLMEAQWLPRNVQGGYLRDVTTRYGGSQVTDAAVVLDAKSWQSKVGAALALPDETRPRGTVHLAVVPVAHALEAVKRAPSGTLLVVVRADRPHLLTRVSHVALVVQKNGRPWLRHASRTFGQVRDEDFEAFLGRNLKYARWTVFGVALYEPLAAEPQGPADGGP